MSAQLSPLWALLLAHLSLRQQSSRHLHKGNEDMKLTDLIEALEKMLDEVGDVYAENEKGQAISDVDYVWDEDDKNVIAVTVS